MMKARFVLRTAAACALSVSLLSGTMSGAETESEGRTVNPEEILGTFFDRAQDRADLITVPDFEGEIRVEASDGLRDAVAEHYRSQEDMSWIQNASLLLRGTSNETRGVDAEAAFSFNDTELYHLQSSYDRSRNIIYAVCPELKEKVLAFPIGDFSADAQTLTGRKVTPEMIADYTTALKELNDLISSVSYESLRSEMMKYVGALGKYVRVDTGIITVTAGSLSEEGHTTTYTLEEDALRAMIPEALRLMAEDEFLQKIVESPFAEHAFRLAVKNKAMKLLPHGTLWKLAQQALLQASEKDYSWGREFSLTIATDRNRIPVHISAALKQGTIDADLFSVSVISDGPDHALEIKAGPVLARRLGIKTVMPIGLLVQGSLKDDILKETVSASVDGISSPVLRLKDIDLRMLKSSWISGAADLNWKDMEYSLDFFVDDAGKRSMSFTVNDREWFVLTADLRKAESVEVTPPDTSDAFTVDSRKTFFKYMRDASAIRMFEKLSSAGVPQEYVDMLTDGEAATESSRENTVELN